jgi:hypothetical protein
MLGALAATYYVVCTVMQVPTGVLNDRNIWAAEPGKSA